MPYIQDHACYPFFDTDRIPCQADQELCVLYPELAPAPFPHLFAEFVLIESLLSFRRGVVPEDLPGGLDLYILEHHFVLREDEEDQLLELVEQSSPFPDVPFSCVVQPSQICRIAFGDYNA